ncbi:MAG: O-antigen ligase family protein [Gemmatimonadaceae bacterium]
MRTPGAAILLDHSTRGALFLTLGVPLYLVPGFFFPFVSVRGFIFRALIVVAGVCFLLRALIADEVRFGRRDWILAALGTLLLVMTASAAFGFSWQRSLFGTFGRLGGVWTWAHLVLLYVLLRSVFGDVQWRWYLRGIVAVGMLACAYALLQRYQVELGIVWEGSPSPPNGPIGNYGIFGGYLLFPLATAAFLVASERGRWRYSSMAALLPLLWVLWLTTNRSSLLGLLFGAVAAAILYSWLSGRARSLAMAALAVGLAIGGVVAAMRPGQPLADLGPRMPYTVKRFISIAPTATGVDRRLQWRAAVLAASERPVLGYGPENHEIVWSKHFDPAIYGLTEDLLWDRTHNAFFEALGTTGLLGLGALLALWVAIVATIRQRQRERLLTDVQASILYGLHVAYFVYLWFWFFDLTGMAIWIAVAAFVGSRRGPRLVLISGVRPWRAQSVGIGAATVFVGAMLAWTYSIAPLLEARRIGGIQLGADTSPGTLRLFRTQLQSTSPYAVSGVALFSRYLSGIRSEYPVLRKDAYFVAELAPTLEQALVAAERARAADPHNDRLVTARTRIMIRASQFYGSPEIAARAEAAAREEVALGPRRIEPRLVLAGVLSANGKLAEALLQTDTALRIYPGLTDIHATRASIYFAAGFIDSAAAQLRAAMPPVDSIRATSPRIPRLDPALVMRVALSFANQGRDAMGADLIRYYLDWNRDLARLGSDASDRRSVADLDRAVASVLPVLYLRAGDFGSARATALELSARCPRSQSAVAAFVEATKSPVLARERYPGSVLSKSTDPVEIAVDVGRVCEPERFAQKPPASG